jgi:hypothetical protein
MDATRALTATDHSRRVTDMDCPACGEPDLDRESVDVEVGIIYGPYGCYCGWSAWDCCYDQTKGPTATAGKRTDQWGFLYPADPAAPGARDTDRPTESVF